MACFHRPCPHTSPHLHFATLDWTWVPPVNRGCPNLRSHGEKSRGAPHDQGGRSFHWYRRGTWCPCSCHRPASSRRSMSCCRTLPSRPFPVHSTPSPHPPFPFFTVYHGRRNKSRRSDRTGAVLKSKTGHRSVAVSRFVANPHKLPDQKRYPTPKPKRFGLRARSYFAPPILTLVSALMYL